MKKLTVVAALVAAACGAQKPVENSPPPGRVTLATFTGEVNPEKGTFTIRTEPTSTGSTGLDPSALVIPEGASSVTIANAGSTPNVDVWNKHVSPTGACSNALVTGARVIVTQKYPSPTFLGAVYAEITAITGGTGVSACNSSEDPEGLDATWGLWSYGDLTWTPSGIRNPNSKTVEWNFLTGTSAPFSFSGRIVAVKGRVDAAFTNTVSGIRSWGDTGTQMVVAPNANRLRFVAYDGTLGGTSAALSANANTIAVDASRIWFTTGSAALDPWHGYVGYMTKTGETVTEIEGDTQSHPLLDAIVTDPSTSTRAWYMSRSRNFFRSIDAGASPTLGTARPFGSNCGPYDMVFGANGNLFFTCQGGTILEFTTAGALQNTYTPPAGCAGPYAIIRVGATLWFTAQTGGAICTMVPTGSNAATFTVVASVFTPLGLVRGPDGNIWATHYSDGTNYFSAVARATAAGDASYGLLLPTTNSPSNGIGASSTALFTANPNGVFRLEP
jgi:hypothetical protein